MNLEWPDLRPREGITCFLGCGPTPSGCKRSLGSRDYDSEHLLFGDLELHQDRLEQCRPWCTGPLTDLVQFTLQGLHLFRAQSNCDLTSWRHVGSSTKRWATRLPNRMWEGCGIQAVDERRFTQVHITRTPRVRK